MRTNNYGSWTVMFSGPLELLLQKSAMALGKESTEDLVQAGMRMWTGAETKRHKTSCMIITVKILPMMSSNSRGDTQ